MTSKLHGIFSNYQTNLSNPFLDTADYCSCIPRALRVDWIKISMKNDIFVKILKFFEFLINKITKNGKNHRNLGFLFVKKTIGGRKCKVAGQKIFWEFVRVFKMFVSSLGIISQKVIKKKWEKHTPPPKNDRFVFFFGGGGGGKKIRSII